MAAEAVVQHPEYLDDDGQGVRCYLRYDIWLSRGEAEKRIEHLGFEWEFPAAESSVVWMTPGVNEHTAEDWYDEVPEGTDGAVRYWKFSWA